MSNPQDYELLTQTAEIQVLLWTESGISWMSLV